MQRVDEEAERNREIALREFQKGVEEYIKKEAEKEAKAAEERQRELEREAKEQEELEKIRIQLFLRK